MTVLGKVKVYQRLLFLVVSPSGSPGGVFDAAWRDMWLYKGSKIFYGRMS